MSQLLGRLRSHRLMAKRSSRELRKSRTSSNKVVRRKKTNVTTKESLATPSIGLEPRDTNLLVYPQITHRWSTGQDDIEFELRNFENQSTITMRQDTKELFAVGKVDALMNAARTADTDAIMKLFLEPFDLSCVDEDGNTALHISAMNGHQYVCRMLIVLASPDRLWEVKNKAGLIAEELALDGRVKEDLRILREGEQRKEDQCTRWNDEIISDTTEWKPNGKVLLALDGGGIKSLVLTQILLALEKELTGEFLPRIDWIAGTSSGGITALMLCHGKSLIEAKRFFIENRFRVFCGNKVKVPKHDSKGIEDTAKQIFGLGYMSSFPKDGPRVMVTVADTRKSPANLVLFRSFAPQIPESIREQLNYLDPEKILIWKAARCTSAAPFYFDSYNGLSDGGLVANNPTQALIADFLQTTRLEKEHSPIEKDDPDPCMACVVSIGTGTSPAEDTNGIDLNFSSFFANKRSPLQMARGFITVVNNAKNMLQILVRECTSSSGQPVRYSREWCHSLKVPFFRFSPMLRTAVQLDNTDTNVIIQMLWETECYIRGAAKYDLQQLAKFLEMKPQTTSAESDQSIKENTGDNKQVALSTDASQKSCV